MSAQPDAPDSVPRLSTDEVLPLLCEGEMTVVEMLPWSSNYTLLVELSEGEYDFHAVYKPRQGERPLWDFPRGTLYQREVAAFYLSHALGWNIVPPTVVREGSYGIGMVQFFVAHDPDIHFFTLREPWTSPLTRIALFDVIANNADRKGGHLIQDTSGHIWGIDHGLCFHHHTKLRTVIWDLAGQPIPEPLVADLIRVREELRAEGELFGRLRHLLAKIEVDALERRLIKTIQQPTFPAPPSNRIHVPWPMI